MSKPTLQGRLYSHAMLGWLLRKMEATPPSVASPPSVSESKPRKRTDFDSDVEYEAYRTSRRAAKRALNERKRPPRVRPKRPRPTQAAARLAKRQITMESAVPTVPQGQYGWHRVSGTAGWKRGWLQVVNAKSGSVKILWDKTTPECAKLGEEHMTLAYIHLVDSSDADPHAAPEIPSRPFGLRKRASAPCAPQYERRRLSIQLYGSYPTDHGTLQDLRKSLQARSSSIPWRGNSGVVSSELERAAELIRVLFPANERARESSDPNPVWAPYLATILQHRTSVLQAEDRPSHLAAQAITDAPLLAGQEVVVSATPYCQGKHPTPHPTCVVEAMMSRRVDLQQRSSPTGEALLATIKMAGGRCERAPSACTVKPEGAHHPAYGYAPVHVQDVSAEMEELLDELDNFLTETQPGSDGLLYSNYERLRFSCKDGCSEASIYVGCCSGFKRQPPLSKVIGQYNTSPHSEFSFPAQIAIKRQFMDIVNRYAALAEEQVRVIMPQHYALQAELRSILAKHPVFRQTFAQEPWFSKWSHPDYLGCGLISKLFTNAYISIGSRTRGAHTDYNNPLITHLTTRLFGDWTGQAVTGQTVLFDRHATRAIIIDDSPKGKQLIGGLNGVLHANLGPCGDVATDKGLLK